MEDPYVHNAGQHTSWTGNVQFTASGGVITNTDGAGNPWPTFVANGSSVQSQSGTNSATSKAIATFNNTTTHTMTTADTVVDEGPTSLTLRFASFGHGIVLHGGSRNKISGGKTLNCNYICVYDAGCDICELIDYDITFDNTDGDSGTGRTYLEGFGRSFNSSTLDDSGFRVKSATVVDGGFWYGDNSATGKLAGWNINVGANGSRKSVSISNLVVFNNGSTAKEHIGKIEKASSVLLHNVRSQQENVAWAVDTRSLVDGARVVVDNCYFGSGSIIVTTVNAADVVNLDVRCSVFADCTSNSFKGASEHCIHIGSGIVKLNLDSGTFFDLVPDAAVSPYRYFLNRADTGNLSADVINTFDCRIRFNDDTALGVVFRSAGEFGNIRLGPNFKCSRVNGTYEVLLSLGAVDRDRLAITDLVGVGHFQSRLNKWYSGKAGVFTKETGTGSPTVWSNYHQIDTGTDKFPNTVGRLGDRIVNDNPANGYAKEWMHDGTEWVAI